MTRFLCFWFASFLTTSIGFWMLAAAEKNNAISREADRFLEDFANSADRGLEAQRTDESGFKDDSPPSYRQRRSCAVGAAVSQSCVAAAVDQHMKTRETLLNNPLLPGKRSGIISTNEIPVYDDMTEKDNQQQQSISDDLFWRTDDISSGRNKLLGTIIKRLYPGTIPEPKRGCMFNLGGHCSTESAAYIADLWHYLDSPASPGRKRSLKTTEITRKLLEEQLSADKE